MVEMLIELSWGVGACLSGVVGTVCNLLLSLEIEHEVSHLFLQLLHLLLGTEDWVHLSAPCLKWEESDTEPSLTPTPRCRGLLPGSSSSKSKLAEEESLGTRLVCIKRPYSSVTASHFLWTTMGGSHSVLFLFFLPTVNGAC